MTIPSRLANAFRTWLNYFMIIITSQVTTCSWYQIDANKRSWITWLVNNLKKPFHCHGITAETVLAHMSWIASFCSSWMATRSVCIASTNIYFQIVRVYGMKFILWTDCVRKWTLVRIWNHNNRRYIYIDIHLFRRFADMAPIHN